MMYMIINFRQELLYILHMQKGFLTAVVKFKILRVQNTRWLKTVIKANDLTLQLWFFSDGFNKCITVLLDDSKRTT